MNKKCSSSKQLPLAFSFVSSNYENLGTPPLKINSEVLSISIHRNNKLLEQQNKIREKILSRVTHLTKTSA